MRMAALEELKKIGFKMATFKTNINGYLRVLAIELNRKEK